jgi:hypothetical protein
MAGIAQWESGDSSWLPQVAEFESGSRLHSTRVPIAQMIERLLMAEQVGGLSPPGCTILSLTREEWKESTCACTKLFRSGKKLGHRRVRKTRWHFPSLLREAIGGKVKQRFGAVCGGFRYPRRRVRRCTIVLFKHVSSEKRGTLPHSVRLMAWYSNVSM